MSKGAGFDCKKKYLRITIFLLEEIFAIFGDCVHNSRSWKIYIQKCVLALIFANASLSVVISSRGKKRLIVTLRKNPFKYEP